MASTELTALRQVCEGSIHGKRNVNTLMIGMKRGPQINPDMKKKIIW
jgi:hypothetical protein